MFNQIKYYYKRLIGDYSIEYTIEKAWQNRWDYSLHMLLMLPPLKRDCQEWLSYKQRTDYGTGRKEIYEKTVELIEKWEKEKDNLAYLTKNDLQDELCGYVGKHIHWY